MRTGAKRAAWLLGAMTALLAGAVLWLFYDGGPPPRGGFALDLPAIRREAARLPGPGPAWIEDEITSHTPAPAIAMTTGAGWGRIDLVRVAYRLRWRGRTLMIDTGDQEQEALRNGAASYDRAARARLVRALDDTATTVLVTHEHGDHLGGALNSPHIAQVAPRMLLTPEQENSPDRAAWPAGVPLPRPLGFHTMRAVAPGVVLIRAPGHTPGSQLIYVRRADGREFLFMGDVASMLDNIRLGRQRSRFVTSWRQHSDRQAVADEIAAIGRAVAADPALVLVPGHDGAAIAALERAGLLRRGFRF